ncbi:MAG TPA: acyl-CoA dehydrogenase family protein [Acidimicrobiales bacterium]|nr:acyl-CoA dehydrogenase family protein [Acidimicrobiales bacterium]
MDLEPSADQVDLQAGVRKLCEGRFPMETVRGGFTRDGWQDLVDAGVFSLRLPETAGGVGLGAAEAVLVFEELGRACVPGPLVASELVGASDVVGLVERGDTMVEHLDVLDRLLVLDGDGVFAVDPQAVAGERVERPIDALTPAWRVDRLPAGERVGDAAPFRLDGALLTAALQLGLSEAVLDIAVAYAKERRQFDKPIGSFQAVKHMLADMLVRTEVARAAVYAAGVTVDDPTVGDPARAVSAAKVTAGEAAIRNGKAAIQVHGGMGFTWEVDVHFFLKRAWVLDTHFGTADHHSERLAASLL